MSETIKKNLYVANYLLEKDIAGRSLQVFSDDIFLVSYPESGNTWTRFLLGNLMNPHDGITFANVERKVPDIYAESKLTLKKTPRPRVIKSHECFDPRYRRVIYIVRDPRDVALSAYHYDRKERNLPDNFPLDTYVTTRIMKTDGYYGTWGERAGSWLVNENNIPQISHRNDGFMGAVGSSGDNVMSWQGARGHDRELLLVRYEDLLEDTEHEMTRISEFLGLAQISPEPIAKAVQLSTADSMRKLEAAQSHQWVTTKQSRKDIPFVRSAKSGQWQQSLPSSSVAEIESAWGPVMKLLGYPLRSEMEKVSSSAQQN